MALAISAGVAKSETLASTFIDFPSLGQPLSPLDQLENERGQYQLHRDKADRGYTMEAVMDTILRRMPDYTRYICPQFTETDINFQRVPTVDTSNPFTARWIPTADELMVIIRFARPAGIDFSYLLSMLRDSFMSRANSIVIPGNKLDLAMQLILTPLILQLVERRKRLTQGRKIDERAGESF